jgi:hypothetical protein
MVEIDSHPSVESEALRRETAAALRDNRLDPKSLYVTPRQTQLWREVFLRHSPIQRNPEFARIYREAFAQTAQRIGGKEIFLVGLGCGTGLKELELHNALAAHGAKTLFAAIDASRDLVLESAQRLVAAGAEHRRSLVCDLAQADEIGRWLDRAGDGLPRVITFFGLFPNFAPSVVTRLFRAVLRPGDLLLASAHLAPGAEENQDDLATAMEKVLLQYDNPETLAWLRAAVEEAGLADRVGPPEMKIGRIEDVPAFVATAPWKSGQPAEPLRLFYSLRYTPALFEGMLRREGFRPERHAITACREEGIWVIQLSS